MACSCIVKGGTFRITNTVSTNVNRVDNIEPIRFCHWAAPEWGNVGQTAENTIYKAALVAVATLNTLAQIEIANKRYKIAKEYANIATDRWQRFRDTYAPCERTMVAEICNTPVYEAEYALRGGEWQGYAVHGFQESDRRLGDFAKRYYLCIDPSLVRDMQIAGAIVQTDNINYAYRYEEAQEDINNDLRWNRRSSALNLGKNIHAHSARYAEAASNAFGNLGEIANQGAAGAISALGFLNERNETFYPAQYSGNSIQGMANVNSVTGDTGFSSVDDSFSDIMSLNVGGLDLDTDDLFALF